MPEISEIFSHLEGYLKKEAFKGWDPFDGLNSKLFQRSIFRYSRLFRLMWLQFFKISPINFRRLLRVPKDYNPKGLGLILSGYCNKYSVTSREEDLQTIEQLISILLRLKSSGYSGSCWGYNFDWQARAFFQPKGTPNVVVTTFIANGLLDAYDILKDDTLLREARSACDFILNDLNRTTDAKGNFCFSYSPLDHTQVFNATTLASKLLSRVYRFTREETLKQAAKQSIDFCIPYQRKDGAWPYGTLPFHQWVDSFHTGYIIECLTAYQRHTGEMLYQPVIERSTRYYLSTFFGDSGIPKYYPGASYPVDIHSPAQLLVTLFHLGLLKNKENISNKVLSWTFNNMWSKKGYFYYQKRRWWISRIPYMRWSQAWMFYALSIYIKHCK